MLSRCNNRFLARTRHQDGLTFSELLVVTTIMAMMVSVTVQTSAGFRNRGKSLICRNNLRQIVMGYRLYSTTHRESPASSVSASRGTPRRRAELAGYSTNFLGYYTREAGFQPQGLGRLIYGGMLNQANVLHCSSDAILLSDSPITGLNSPTEPWTSRYPLQSSFITRPVGMAAPAEQESALKNPLEANPGTSVLITEISNNHPDGVHVAYVNGAAEFIKGVPVPAQAFSAIGTKKRLSKSDKEITVLQPSYRFDFALAPWIWLALEDPANAEQIIKDNLPLTRKGKGEEQIPGGQSR